MKSMTYVIVIAALLALIAALTVFLSKGRGHRAPQGEPLDISGWVKVDREVATAGEFVLRGDAVNYGNGRPYKLRLKRESDGRTTWYAEFLDTGEWYKTNIGQGEE